MAFNKQEKLRDNIEAIRLLFDLEVRRGLPVSKKGRYSLVIVDLEV